MTLSRFFLALSLAAALAAGPVWAETAAETSKNPAATKASDPTSTQATPAAPAPTAVPPAIINAPPPSSFLAPHTVSAEEALSSLKADLKITDAQTKNWENFAASALDSQKSAKEAAARPPGSSNGVYDVLQSRQKYMKARADGLEKMAAAFKPLYDSFSSEQKAAADRIIPQRLGMVM